MANEERKNWRRRLKVPKSANKGEIIEWHIDDAYSKYFNVKDPVYLSQLADLTADHGGASFLPENIDELITTIQDRRSLAETPVIEKFRLGDGPFTGWLLFGIFAGAMSTEWFLRRQWGLA